MMLQEISEELRTGKIEFLPLDVGINKHYYLVNATNVIDVLDMEWSGVVYFFAWINRIINR